MRGDCYCGTKAIAWCETRSAKDMPAPPIRVIWLLADAPFTRRIASAPLVQTRAKFPMLVRSCLSDVPAQRRERSRTSFRPILNPEIRSEPPPALMPIVSLEPVMKHIPPLPNNTLFEFPTSLTVEDEPRERVFPWPTRSTLAEAPA